MGSISVISCLLSILLLSYSVQLASAGACFSASWDLSSSTMQLPTFSGASKTLLTAVSRMYRFQGASLSSDYILYFGAPLTSASTPNFYCAMDDTTFDSTFSDATVTWSGSVVNSYVQCPTGSFLVGLQSSGNRLYLSDITSATCRTVTSRPANTWGNCVTQSTGNAFLPDYATTVTCPTDYFMVGYQTSSKWLYNLNGIKCCQLATWKTTTLTAITITTYQSLLSPAFSSSTSSYTMTVDATVSSLMISISKSQSVQTVSVSTSINGGTRRTLFTSMADGTGYNFALTTGTNSLVFTVTAQDTTYTQTYTISITRQQSSDSSISSLKIAQDFPFSRTQTSYTINVPNSLSSTTVTAIPFASSTTLAYTAPTANGQGNLVSGTPSQSIGLFLGSNTITVKGTSQTGTTTTYTLTIIRACDNTATCNNFGTCNSNYGCNCNTGYTGTNCNSCASGYFNYPSCTFCTSANCNGQPCTSTGTCNCASNYFGTRCEQCAANFYGSTCLPCPRNSTGSVCSARGTCNDGVTGDGTCLCKTGFAGSLCQYSDAVNCNNRGKVSDSGVCTCNTGWAGSSCNVCATGYSGTSCNVYCDPSTPSSSCSSNGICNPDGTCKCNTGFGGTTCTSCLTNYYNYPACTFCLASQTCNNNGVCTAQGTCTCTKTGFTGTNCNTCTYGRYGSTCTECPGGETNPCSGRGFCSMGSTGTGLCTCSSPYKGVACADPIVSSIEPMGLSTAGNSRITIRGYAFDGKGTARVEFTFASNVKSLCTNVEMVSEQRIDCFLPAGQPSTGGTASVLITFPSATTLNFVNAGAITYTFATPSITTVSPTSASAAGGTSIVVTGDSFGTSPSVFFNGRYVNPSVVSHTQVTFLLPAGVGANIPIIVSSAGRNSSTVRSFSYAAPQITSSTSPVTSGGSVVIRGSNFGTSTLASNNIQILIGGSSCTPVTSWNDSSLICTAAAGSGADLPMIVTIAGQLATSTFSYAVPTITNVTGCSNGAIDCNPDGTTITIQGSNFGPAVNNSAGALLTVTLAYTGTSGVTTYTTCSSVAMVTAHRLISCLLPRGAGLGISVIVSRGTQSATLASAISYSSPSITRATLRLSTSASATTDSNGRAYINLLSTSGVESIIITGSNFGASAANILINYGPASNPAMYNCTSVTIVTTNTAVSCVVSAGVGGPYYVQVSRSGIVSQQSFDYILYPLPIITANSLRLQSSSVIVNPVLGSGSQGDTLVFSGQYFGTNKDLVTVTYGPSSNPTTYSCVVQSMNNTFITCVTSRGDGINYVFRVSTGPSDALRVGNAGTDQFSYPQVPIITSVSGCTNQISSTVNCPTTGYTSSSPILLTITGSYFDGVSFIASVTVGGKSCDNVIHSSINPSSSLTCRLPSGVGLNQDVVVSVGTTNVKFSAAYQYVSYSVPVITSVLGCSIDNSNPLITFNCTRAGGTTLTIRGNSFGSSNAKIVVGGISCTNVTHSITNPHSELTCSIPSGTTVYRTVLVVQDGGEASSSLAYVSMAQCVPGTFAPDGQLQCSTCPAGSYSSESGQTSCLICPATTYSATSGMSSCTSCSPGSYNNAINQTSCQLCPSGQYQPSSGAFSCLPCPGGSFSSSTGSSICTSCSPGQYQSLSGQMICINCPVGKYQLAPGQLSCIDCTPGTYTSTTSSTSCIKSPLGSFVRSVGASNFTNCDAGYYSNALSSTSCLSCAAGTYQPSRGATTCIPCASGNYTSSSASLSCTACVEGKVSTSTGAATCDACPAGYFADKKGLFSCSACPSGTYQPNTGSSVCLNCPAGQYQNGQGQKGCISCSSGTYSSTDASSACSICPAGKRSSDNTGSVSCVDCIAGTYNDVTGSSTCTSCGAGDYADTAAMIKCLSCPVGTSSSSTGSATCSICTAGKYASQSRSTSCSDCPAGKFSSANSANCTSCSPGFYQDQVGQSGCKPCPTGSECPISGLVTPRLCAVGLFANTTGNSACQECKAGSYSTAGSSVCTLCSAGFFSASDRQASCVACGSGTYASDRGSSVCTSCPIGKIQSFSGQSQCIDCDAGYYMNSIGQTQCFQCTAGRYTNVTGSAVCIDCQAGSYQKDGGKTMCDSCPVGYYGSLTAQTTCTECSAGSYTNIVGLTSCIQCVAGYFQGSTGRSLCSPCANGTFAPLNSATTCLSCSAGRFRNGIAGTSCDSCPIGRYQSNSGATSCTACEMGKYASTTEQTSCFSCDRGSYSNAQNSTICTTCAAGSYQDQIGQTSCPLCSNGTSSSNTGSTSCTICSAGFFATLAGSLNCTQCPAGKYSALDRSPSCTSCPKGKYQNAPSQSLCRDCDPGKVQANEGGASCTVCQAGFYSNSPTECRACAAGSYSSLDGASSCTITDPGQFSSRNASTNYTLCSPGTYQPVAGQSSCLACPVGTVQSGTGQSSCSACAIGKVQASTGGISCTDCPVGFYSFSASECRACSLGKYASDAGSSACKTCDTGSFASFNASTNCTVCPVGTVQPSKGQGSCIICSAGTYQAGIGQSSCKVCEDGKAQPTPGSTSCIACPAGYYSFSATSCRACAVGTYAPKEGLSNCTITTVGTYTSTNASTNYTVCPAGTYQPLEGQSTCLLCESGKYQSGVGQTKCIDCPDGSAQPLPGKTQCNICDAGYYSVSATECRACEAGKISANPGLKSCSICKAGTYTATNASTLCTDCPPGYYQPVDGQGSCLPCKAGQYQTSSKSTTCSACETGKVQSIEGQTFCTSCQAGYYSFSAAECRACEPGTYAKTSSLGSCESCPAGKFSSIGASANCTDCAAGTYQSQSGQSRCLVCAPGTYQPSVGKTGFLTCDAGSIQASSGGDKCTPCPIGYYSVSGVACSACEPGKFGSQQGSSQCESCAIGSYSAIPASTECTKVPVGTYQPNEGQSTFIPCPAGTYQQNSGQDNCKACETGKVQPLAGNITCDICPAGKFAASKTECRPCSAGYFQSLPGNTTCAECPVGKYIDTEGATGCINCPVGTYQKENAQKSCLACDPGTYQASVGQTTCVSCSNGTVQPSYGNASCYNCPSGFYSFNTTLCRACDPGKFGSSDGLSSCSSCSAGTYSDLPGSTRCISCPPGTAQSQPAQSSCLDCMAGYKSADARATSCTICPTGSYNSATKSTNCTLCDAGSYSSQQGQQSCDLCPAGKFSQTGWSNCELCGNQMVSLEAGSSTCLQCEYTSDSSRQICLCPVGQALTEAENSTRCDPCPEGATCVSQQQKWSTLEAQSGYYKGADGIFYRCLLDTHCVGGSQVCASNREGALCALCSSGYTEGVGGVCVECYNGGGSVAFFIIISLAIAAIFFGLCYLVLYSSKGMMKAAAVDEERRIKESAGYIWDYEEGYVDEQRRFGNVVTWNGPPPPKANFTYKLKIAVGFLQIVTSMAMSMNIPWPNGFKRVLQWFNPSNLDFVQLSSVGCVLNYDYFDKMWTFCVIPGVLLAVILLCFTIPQYYRYRGNAEDSRIARKIVRRQTWRLIFFVLFLVYPTVSSFVLRAYVCTEVNGINYLVSDFTVLCSGDYYNKNVGADVIMIVLYPVGIPLFIFYCLWRYRKRLDQVGVRAQFGFLYDGYERQFWFFELVDLAMKLILSSLITFLPNRWQMGGGLVFAGAYMMILLSFKPFVRKGDDRLQLFAVTEIFMLMLAGHLFSSGYTLDSSTDTLVSALLLLIFLSFLAFFLVQCIHVVRKFCRKRQQGNKKETDEDDEDLATTGGNDDTTKKQEEKPKQTNDKHIPGDIDLPVYHRVKSKVPVGSFDNQENVQWGRNPLFAKDYQGSGGEALYDSTTGTEFHATLNPLSFAGGNVSNTGMKTQRIQEDVQLQNKLKGQQLLSAEHGTSDDPEETSL